MQDDQTLSCHVTQADDDSQSQSQVTCVAVPTETPQNEQRSHVKSSEKEEESAAPHLAVSSEEEQQRQQIPEYLDEEEAEEQKDGTEQEDKSEVEEEDPVSPVLELDPSLDTEVMELMTSSPTPSLLHPSSSSPPLFSQRGKSRTLRPPPCSSRPSDDLSVRLRQSPFSTEASPETSPARAPITPPPLSPPSPLLRSSPSARESPPLSKVKDKIDISASILFLLVPDFLNVFAFPSQAPPSTVLPFTPKIGMGKPAISKRKFSPGRSRIKQVRDL